MIAEFLIGRHSQANTARAYQMLAPGTQWRWVGRMGVLAGFLILGYYSVVAGWTLEYIFEAVSNSFAGKTPAEFISSFQSFSSNPWRPALWLTLFLLATHFIIVKGVEKGIEKSSKIMMPTLFIIILIRVGCSVTLPGAGKGIEFLLKPDFSKVDGNVFLGAMGQAFFSLSLGMAIMVTYGSYVKKEENLAKNAAIICGMDTLVALIAGFIIVPAVFATLGAEGVGKGAGFAFSSLAGVFQQMPGGQFFGILFYMLLLFAALTSCISLVEGVVAFATERFGWKRTPTTIILCVVMFLLGTIYTCSQAAFDIKGIWFDFKNGLTTPIFGDFMEFLTDRLMIPVCALGSCLFVGWAWKPQNAIREIELDGKPFRLKKAYSFLVKYLAPISIIIIIVASFATGTTLS